MKRRTLLAISPLVAAPIIAHEALAEQVSVAWAAPGEDTGKRATAEVFLDRWALVPRAPRPPVLSGKLDDPLWETAAVLDDFRVFHRHEPAEDTFEGRVLYGADALHVGVRVVSPEHWEDLVSVDVVLATAATGNDHFVVPLMLGEHPWYPKLYVEAGGTVIDDLEQVRTIDSGTGTVIVEVAIPYDRLGNPDTKAGTEWWINLVGHYAMMTLPMNSWAPNRRSTDYYSGGAHLIRAWVVEERCLASLVLAGSPGDVNDGVGLVDPDSAGVELAWVSFTEKELSIPAADLPGRPRFTVAWKGPGGSWTPIAGKPTVDGDTVRVKVEHPPPLRNGAYQLRLLSDRPAPEGRPAPRTIITTDRDALISAGIQHYELNGGQ